MIVRRSQLIETPWRNGGGVTLELATDGSNLFGWRVSVATVAIDGPFSDFSRHRRAILLLDGAGMRLHHPAGVTALLGRGANWTFDGALPVVAELVDGPTRDFNLIVAEGHGHPEVALITTGRWRATVLHALSPGAFDGVEVDVGDTWIGDGWVDVVGEAALAAVRR